MRSIPHRYTTNFAQLSNKQIGPTSNKPTGFRGILTAFALFAFVHVGLHLHWQMYCFVVFPGFGHAFCKTHIPYQPLCHDSRAQALKG